MERKRRAVIDVGTNSVKLLVADVVGHEVIPLHEESKQTRLGKGFYETHLLQPEPIARTAEAVWEFTEVARDRQADSVKVIATSAARDAKNAADLTGAIHRACGLPTAIISGEQEADWAFQGVATDVELAKHSLLLLDVGGGSTEFILGRGQKKHFARSFPLGTVRLMERFPPSDPPSAKELAACRAWLKDFIITEVRPFLEPALVTEKNLNDVLLVGTGGTTSILGRMENRLDRFDREKIEHTILGYGRVTEWSDQLWKLPLAKRKEIVGLPKLRADVILTGVLIYEAIMQHLGFTELRISTRGLRFAAVMD